MANEKHVALLRQGIHVWNAWREKEPSTRPDLSGANLNGAYLIWPSLSVANLYEADLSYADLTLTNLVQTNLTRADLKNCRIYGVSAWGVKLEEAKQQNLVTTTDGKPEITVDNIE